MGFFSAELNLLFHQFNFFSRVKCVCFFRKLMECDKAAIFWLPKHGNMVVHKNERRYTQHCKRAFTCKILLDDF